MVSRTRDTILDSTANQLIWVVDITSNENQLEPTKMDNIYFYFTSFGKYLINAKFYLFLNLESILKLQTKLLSCFKTTVGWLH